MLDPTFQVFDDTPQTNTRVNVAFNQYDEQDRLFLATGPEVCSVAYAYSPDLGSLQESELIVR